MKLYITKYGLTQGIFEVDNSENQMRDCGDHYYGAIKNGAFKDIFIKGKTIFDNLEDAKKAVDDMRLKKIESLQKSMKKMENLKVKINYATV